MATFLVVFMMILVLLLLSLFEMFYASDVPYAELPRQNSSPSRSSSAAAPSNFIANANRGSIIGEAGCNETDGYYNDGVSGCGPLEVNCTSPSAEIDPSCWTSLDLSNFLNQWSSTTPYCTSTDSSGYELDTDNCCVPNESWSDCFLRLGLPYSGTSCYDIDSCIYEGIPLRNNLSSPGNWYSSLFLIETANAITGTESDAINAAYHYIVYNIYAVNWFFSTWYHALTTAFSESTSTITGIVEVVDPTQKTHVALSDVLLAISFGLAFVSGPELGDVADATTKAVGGLLVKLIQQAPGVGKALWPAGTVDSQLYQISELNNLDLNITQGLEDSLARGLQLVLGDLDTFINFTFPLTGLASFSVPQAQRPSLSNETNGLLTALTTFLVSSALVANGWDAVVVAGIDPYEMSTNKSAVLPDWASYDCESCRKETNLGCNAYDSNGQCGRYWYSPNITCAFTLGGRFDEDPGHLISQIFDNHWTTGELLFQRSATCDVSAGDVNGTETLFSHYKYAENDTEYINVFQDSIDAQDYQTLPTLPSFWLAWANDTAFERKQRNLTYFDDPGPLGDEPYERTYIYPYGSTRHPNNTLLNYTQSGIDFSCTSQLSLTIMTSWYDVIHELFP